MPRVGLDAYSLTGPSRREICEPDIFVMLRTVKELGGEGLQAALPSDAGAIRDAFALADELGLYLEPYLPLPLHWRGEAAIIEQREHQFHLVVEQAATHGVMALHCTLGARERFEDPSRWKEFVTATAACLQRLAPEIREHRVRIGIENHWDYSTYEIIEIAETVGPDIVGVGLDTGNLPILAEAPAAGIRRSAPYAVTTHLKDVMLFSTPRGAARPIVPIGSGQVGMAEAVRELYQYNREIHFTIEDHAVIYHVEYFEPWWLAAVPELTTHDIATMARLAREGDRLLVDHQVADPHAAELVPWSIRGPARLRQDILTVKQFLAEIEAVVSEPLAANGNRG